MVEKIKDAVIELIESHDCYLDDIELKTENKELHLKLAIDFNEGHIDMDSLVEMSELIGNKLDELNLINQEYFLDVASPGAEKPLRTLEQVEKSIGEYVHIELNNPIQGLYEIEGTFYDYLDGRLYLQYFVKGVKKKIEIPYESIKFIRLAVKF